MDPHPCLSVNYMCLWKKFHRTFKYYFGKIDFF